MPINRAHEHQLDLKERNMRRMKKNNKKGFTLAELLIVVAIIAVLVAVSIPVFTAQLHKAQDATDLANIRSYYAELQTAAITDGVDSSKAATDASSITLSDGESITLNNLRYTVTVGTDHYTVSWACKDGDSCKSAQHSGVFGGAPTT